jgi:hypothetical protein
MKNKLLLLAMGFALTTQMIMAQVPSYVPTNGLVAYWPFNGNANDESGNRNNGTVNGATLTADRFGNVDNAYQFNANQENFISITTNGANRNVTTISCWIKFDGPIGGGLPIQALDWYSIIDGFLLNGYSNDSKYKKIIFNYNNQPISSSQINFNEWNHIVITIDLNGLCSFIFDGNFAGSQSIIGNYSIFPSIINSNSNISFVGKSINNGWYFNGKIDDIGIWNRVLTQQEITNLYNSTNTNECLTMTINTGVLSTNPVTYTSTVNIYPNPANDQITIDCGTLANVVGWNIKITNMLGQEVFNQPMNTQQYVVPLNSWTGQGMYFVKINNAQNEVVNIKKIILQ